MSEKAQSKLYKFKEKQSADMGMGDRQKGDRRPRMASSVTNLRDCERWRGDIMRDISRKVSKISDCKLIVAVFPARKLTASWIIGLSSPRLER
jgi:pre-mRNA-splicing factor ISY1